MKRVVINIRTSKNISGLVKSFLNVEPWTGPGQVSGVSWLPVFEGVFYCGIVTTACDRGFKRCYGPNQVISGKRGRFSDSMANKKNSDISVFVILMQISLNNCVLVYLKKLGTLDI